MAKDFGQWALVLVIVGLVGVMYVLSSNGMLSGVGGQAIAKEGSCPTDGLTDLRLAAINSMDKDKAQVGANASLFLKGGFTPLSTTNMSTSGYITMSDLLECGQDYVVVLGYNSTGATNGYYQNIITGLNSGQAAINTIDATNKGLVEKIGAIAITVDNSTVLGAAGVNVTMGASSTNNEVVAHIKSTQAEARFGQGDIMVCSLYNDTNISSVTFAGGVDAVAPKFLTGDQECYKLAADQLVGSSGQLDIRPVITAVDGQNPASDNVVVTVLDYFHYYYQGQDVYGVQHPADKTAYGAADVAFTVSIN